MPYRRAAKGARRKVATRKGYSHAGLVPAVERVLNARMPSKYYDTNVASLQVYAGADRTELLSAIPQGDSQQNRIADQVNPVSIELRGICELPAAVDSSFRIIVFRWLPNTFTTLPHANTILNTSYVGTNLETSSPFEWQYIANRDILWDSGIMVPTNTATGSIAWNKTIKVTSKTKPIRFNDGILTGTNNLFILYVGDTVLANALVVSATHRLIYRDGT